MAERAGGRLYRRQVRSHGQQLRRLQRSARRAARSMIIKLTQLSGTIYLNMDHAVFFKPGAGSPPVGATVTMIEGSDITVLVDAERIAQVMAADSGRSYVAEVT